MDSVVLWMPLISGGIYATIWYDDDDDIVNDDCVCLMMMIMTACACGH